MKRLNITEISNIISRQKRNTGVDFQKMMDDFNSSTIDEVKFREEARLQNIAKMATKDVTGILGKRLAQLMAWLPLTDDEIFELHQVEQIGVQFKNIVKDGANLENNKLVQSALDVARKYGVENTVQQAIGMVVQRDFSDILEAEKNNQIEALSNELHNSMKTEQPKTTADVFSELDAFDF